MELDRHAVRSKLTEQRRTIVDLCRATNLNYLKLVKTLGGGYGTHLTAEEIEALSRAIGVPIHELTK